MARYTLSSKALVMSGLTALAAAIAVAAMSQTAESRQVSQKEIRAQKARAYAKGGLRGAAAIDGTYVREMTVPYGGSPASLDQLVSYSRMIVIGSTSSNVGRLTDNGKSINTYFSVQLQTALKNPTGAAELVLVLPGGRVGFPNGTWAQVNASGLRKMLTDRRYLMFLRPALESLARGQQGQELVMELAFGGLGMYDITDLPGDLNPVGGTDTSFAALLRKERHTNATFVELVRGSISRQ